jgi:hypothetical protein
MIDPKKGIYKGRVNTMLYQYVNDYLPEGGTMRSTICILFMLLAQLANAEPEYRQSGLLDIRSETASGKARSWLEGYEPHLEKTIPITAVFRIKNVRALLITDMNALAGKCGDNRPHNILYLAFDPGTGLKRITTRIHKPCSYQRKTVLRIRVITKDNKRYFNTRVLVAHPGTSTR